MATVAIDQLDLIANPLKFLHLCWPDVVISHKQRQIVESVCENKLTFVPAANMMGKDFITGFIVVWYFISHMPCRVIATSAKADHLEVLWGEIRNFIRSSKFPLDSQFGGPLRVLQQQITRAEDEISYVRSMVASDQSVAAMGGHHAKYTLFVADEASGVNDLYWEVIQGWMKKALIIGNTWPCENFFKHAIKGRPGSKDKGGDILSPSGKGHYRKIIKIKAADSPNVQLGLEEIANGKQPSYRELIPGIKGFREYQENRLLWDEHHQCVALDAEFYEGAEIKLFPPEWLAKAERIFIKGPRKAVSIGVDTAEGGDKTVWTVIDRLGIIEQLSFKTPDTSIIPGRTIALASQYGVPFEFVLFDAGGGGHQHACVLRAQGKNVRTVPFGEQPSDPDNYKRYHEFTKTSSDRREEREVKYIYKNRRAEMYGLLREQLDPQRNPNGFSIPAEYGELHRQLAPLPLWYDEEGRMFLPPKNRKPDASVSGKQKITINQLLGCSPDESDSLVLAVFGMMVVEPAKILKSLL